MASFAVCGRARVAPRRSVTTGLAKATWRRACTGPNCHSSLTKRRGKSSVASQAEASRRHGAGSAEGTSPGPGETRSAGASEGMKVTPSASAAGS